MRDATSLVDAAKLSAHGNAKYSWLVTIDAVHMCLLGASLALFVQRDVGNRSRDQCRSVDLPDTVLKSNAHWY